MFCVTPLLLDCQTANCASFSAKYKIHQGESVLFYFEKVLTIVSPPNNPLSASLYCLHNQENRPNGREMRSLSVSDIIVMHEGGEAHAYYVEPIGYKQVDALLPGLEQAKKRSVERGER